MLYSSFCYTLTSSGLDGTWRYHLGASDFEEDGTFIWETSDLPFTTEVSAHWDFDEPNGATGENHIDAYFTQNEFKFRDINGELITNSFICQKSKVSLS